MGPLVAPVLERRERRMREDCFAGREDKGGGDEAWRGANKELFFTGGLMM